jgi:hypothetical protein
MTTLLAGAAEEALERRARFGTYALVAAISTSYSATKSAWCICGAPALLRLL